jgi:hypothetical protein
MTNYRLYCSLDFDSLSQLHDYVTEMGTHNIQVVDTEKIDDKQQKSKPQKTYHHQELFLPAMRQLQKAFQGMNSVFSSIDQISKGATTSKKGGQRQKGLKVEPKQQKSSSVKRKKPNQSS